MKSVKTYSSKSTLSAVVWGGLIIVVLIFFKSIIKFITELTGQSQSDENKQIQQEQLTYFQKLSQQANKLYSTKGFRNKQYYSDYANNLQAAFDRNETANIAKLIIQMPQPDLFLLYVNFGTRLNTEYTNMQGDLFDWVNKESSTPMGMLNFPLWNSVKKHLSYLAKINPKFNIWK